MAEKKEYRIKIQGSLVDVTEEVYLTYYRMDRQARVVEEREQRNGVLLYSDLDTNESVAVEMFADKSSVPVEEQAISRIMCQNLRDCISHLTADEREIVFRRYWEGKSQSELAKDLCTSQQVISYREKNILSKLKKLLEK